MPPNNTPDTLYTTIAQSDVVLRIMPYMVENLGATVYTCYSANEHRVIIRESTTDGVTVREKTFGKWEDRKYLAYIPIYDKNPDVIIAVFYLSEEKLVKDYVGDTSPVTVYLIPPGTGWVLDPESVPEWVTVNTVAGVSGETQITVTVDKNFGDIRNVELRFNMEELPT